MGNFLGSVPIFSLVANANIAIRSSELSVSFRRICQLVVAVMFLR